MTNIDAATERYLEELDRQMPMRPRSIIKECIVIADYYDRLNLYSLTKKNGYNRFFDYSCAKSSCLLSNTSISSTYNLSLRNYLYKKSIGRNINRNLVSDIESHPKLNKMKFLYELSKQPREMQKIIVERAVSIIERR